MNRRVGGAVGVAVAALVGVAVFGASPSHRSPNLSVTTTSAVPTTSSPSSSSSAFTTSATTTVPTAPSIPGDTGAIGFVPACTPVSATSSAPILSAAPTEMATFGPLGAQPALRFTRPHFRINPGEVPDVTGGSAIPIPGGYLVGVAVSDPSNGFGALYGNSILMAINDDGTVRWRQCRTDGFEGATYVARGSGVVPTQALTLVAQARQPTIRVGYDYRVIDLADGHDEGTLRDRAVAAGLDPSVVIDLPKASDGRTMLFAGNNAELADATRVVTTRDRILDLDLATMKVEVMKPPRAALRRPMTGPWLALSAQGEMAIVDGTFDAPTQQPVALRHGGAWLDEAHAGAALWAASFPVHVVYNFSGPQFSVNGIDAHGTPLWSRLNVLQQGEAPGFLTSGTTTLMIVCQSGPTTSECTDPVLVGADTATGLDRWTLAGSYSIGFAADGVAMVWHAVGSTDGQWQLIELSTGQQVAPDQQWQGLQTFLTDNGGAGIAVEVTRQYGGVVVASNTDISVWLPKPLRSGATKVVSLT